MSFWQFLCLLLRPPRQIWCIGNFICNNGTNDCTLLRTILFTYSPEVYKVSPRHNYTWSIFNFLKKSLGRLFDKTEIETECEKGQVASASDNITPSIITLFLSIAYTPLHISGSNVESQIVRGMCGSSVSVYFYLKNNTSANLNSKLCNQFRIRDN